MHTNLNNLVIIQTDPQHQVHLLMRPWIAISATTWTQIANSFLESEGSALILGYEDLETWRLKGKFITPLKEEVQFLFSAWLNEGAQEE